MSSTIIIKKYSNRRLYNTQESTYISVDDVSDLIKKGFRIKAVDAITGHDITAIVLTQIIMNKTKDDNTILPVSLLYLVVQYGESHLHDFFEKYLETAIENYLGFRKQMDDQVNAYMGIGMDFSSFAEQAVKNIDTMNLFSNSIYKGKKDRGS